MTYAGIGSRKAPMNILKQAETIGASYAKKGYLLVSGGAIGMDTAFYTGCVLFYGSWIVYKAKDATEAAMDLASKYHPAWHNCTPYVKKLMGRNAMIILGPNLDQPVDKVICWTENGSIIGGTGLGIRIANAYGIPVYNLYSTDYKELLINL